MRRLLPLCLGLVAAAVLAAAALVGMNTYRQMKMLSPETLWKLPTRVYSRPFAIGPGVDVARQGLAGRLERLGYRHVEEVERPGEFSRTGGGLVVYLRGTNCPGALCSPCRVRVLVSGTKVARVVSVDTGRDADCAVLEPELLATFYDEGCEDREIVTLARCAPVLIDAVLSVEDTRFYSHHGVDLRALARALIVDVWHGKVEEGGSTITQQLVKNVFLTHDRTVVRKVREAWLACVMERALSKDEILTLYLNEVYLGRYGHAGIHGFARASRLFFDKDVSDLELHEAALLAGLVRSPNRYSPHAHPARAIRRRNTVLMLMARHGRITGEQYARAAAMPLGIVPLETPARRAPYFVDHVISIVGSTAEGREALAAGGLKIYTTLDAHLQEVVENAVADGLAHRGAEMQAACVVIQPATGEILAMTGGRDYRASQFNRAVSLRRNIGSLIKPVVYYEALRKGYTLASVIDDAPVALRLEDGTVWSPENFDGASHGRVMLLQALANSYNQATVGLGLAVGLAEIGRTLGDMTDGVKAPPAPSLLLGAVPMSPLEVAGMYAVFAAGGGRPRPYALVAVTDERDAVIREHDPAPARRVADGRVVFLVNRALEEVLSRGTARSAEGMGIPGGVCGKTGTTNDLRDAWFAAFSGDLVVVTWVGADDYRPVGLTGATGALPIAGRILARAASPWERKPPPGVVFRPVDVPGGAADGTRETLLLPFLSGTEPPHKESGIIPAVMRALRSLWPF